MMSRRLLLVFGLIMAAALVRLVPHAPNFAPVGAMGLFGAAYLRRYWAYLAPFAALFISDLILNNTIYSQYYPSFAWITSPWIYVSTAAMIAVGALWFRQGVTKFRIFGAALSASGVFFLLSNLSVFIETNMYPKTAAGLMMCYTAGLPFLTNTVASDLLYSALLFGAYAWASAKMPMTATTR